MPRTLLPRYMAKGPKDFVRVDLGGTVTAKDIDEKITAALGKSGLSLSPHHGVNLDFSGAKYIESVAFQSVIGLIRSFLILRTPVLVRIPKEKKVRDFMRAWNVAGAFYDALGYSLSLLAPEEDMQFFEETQEFYRPDELPECPRPETNENPLLEPKNFWRFYTEDFRGAPLSSRIAYEERDS